MRRCCCLAAIGIMFCVFAAQVASNETQGQPEALSIDGVRPGMSYDEVLATLGLPQRIRWKENVPVFVYSDDDGPNVVRSTYKKAVWFIKGRAAFCAGTTLSLNGTPVAHEGDKAEGLLALLGKPEELNVFSCWWPRVGVVISAWRTVDGNDKLHGLGIRSLNIPTKYFEGPPGTRWSSFEPWVDDYMELWTMDGIPLGVRRAEVQEFLGHPTRNGTHSETYPTGLIVYYSSSGWVKRVESGKSLWHMAFLGHHMLCHGPYTVGQPVSQIPLNHCETVQVLENGVGQLTPHVNVVYENKLAKRFEMSGEREIFDALDRFATK